MTQFMTVLGFVFTAFTINAQRPVPVKLSMTPENWQSSGKNVEFLQHKGAAAARILSDTARLILKNFDFVDGIIEFDVESTSPPFTGVYFRRQSEEESEYFYLRVARAGSPLAIDAIQYCPVIKGVAIWDLLPEYQAPAVIKKGDWNHIKMVVSGFQMLVYVNDMNRPALQIPRLEGNTKSGAIAFAGKSIFANLVVTPGATNGLSQSEGFDPTYHDPRYIREWEVSTPIDFPFRRDIGGEDLPGPNTSWKRMSSERRGLLNLTRAFGTNKDRRFVWIKAIINSDKDQIRKIDMGFSDEVWVIINGKLAYIDKNWYNNPIMKEPEGRCSVENSSFTIPLKTGSNELWIGVSNFFFGWGIVMRLDRLDGITF